MRAAESMSTILFVIKSIAVPGGGAERVLSEVASEFARRGYRVLVASFDSPGTPSFYPYAQAVELMPLAGLDPLSKTDLADVIVRARFLRRLLKSIKPAVAIGFLPSSYIILALAALGTGIPVVGSEHNVYRNYDRMPLKRAMLNLLAGSLDKVTAVSDHMRSTFPRRLRERMVVVPNPVGQAAGSKLANVRGDKVKTLLSVGRLHPQKDQACLVSAFARLAPRFPDWRLRIVGEGDLRPQLEAQIAASGAAAQVELPGASPTIDKEYLSAQLFCLPSRYESQGLATAEALGHGLPVVGFADCAGTNELVEDGVNGVLVKGSDRAEALRKGLERLMSSAEERQAMASRAPSSVRALSAANVVDQWSTLLKEYLPNV